MINNKNNNIFLNRVFITSFLLNIIYMNLSCKRCYTCENESYIVYANDSSWTIYRSDYSSTESYYLYRNSLDSFKLTPNDSFFNYCPNSNQTFDYDLAKKCIEKK